MWTMGWGGEQEGTLGSPAGRPAGQDVQPHTGGVSCVEATITPPPTTSLCH